MALNTDLSVVPYGDDYDATKDFAKFLFKPGVSVQVRELNQLQTLLQKQIERFGDNIFKQGTIVSGCNFTFYPEYPYIKILDNEVDGTTATPSRYEGHFAVCENTGLKAVVLDTTDGFESTDPDMKTLYLRYQNAGDSGIEEAFNPGDIVTIKNLEDSIWKVVVTNGGSAFTNTDTVVASSRLIVNVASGSFSNGDYVINNLGANVQIIGIDTTTYANAEQVVLTVKPRDVDLTSAVSTANSWTFQIGEAVTNQANGVSARVEGLIGQGFRGRPVTDAVGRVRSVLVLSRGQKYSLPPTLTIWSINNASGVAALDLSAQNYIGKIRVSTTGGAVGNGYGFAVSEGVIYQKGYFLRVAPQSIIVEKYSTTPNAVACGFYTQEEIVDFNQDSSLRDPANNTENFGAPGADRLKLTPVLQLTTKSEADANADFFTIVEWSEGRPYKQNQNTIYNKIEEEMAKRTAEESGDYVVDSFLMSTRSPIDPSKEGNTYSVVVDPGIAYINGHRVQTFTNFVIDVPKGIDTKTTNSHSVNLNYGNYVYLNNVGGTFQFNTGDVVELYDTAKGYVSNVAAIIAQDLAPTGTKIGTARIRSLMVDEGIPGSASAIYRLYLFNINMNAGKNFRDIRAVYYNGVKKGIGDIVLSPEGANGANIAVLNEANTSTLLFSTGVESLKNANNVSYIYRTVDQGVGIANTGTGTKNISAMLDEEFPYTGALTSAQMQELYVVPTAVDLVYAANISGTISVNTTSPNVVGSGTAFLTDLREGDYIYAYANAIAFEMKRVVSIVNNTLAIVDSNVSFANATAGAARAFPVGVPIPFGYRSGLSANVNTAQNILTLNFGASFSYSGSANVSLGVNIRRVNVTQLTKTPVRNRFVKICLANNEANTLGPWCLGVPDVFRLRGVWIGNSTVSNTGTNSLTSFFVDHNQNPDFLDLSYLYLVPKNNINLTNSHYLLAEIDYFTSSGTGYVDTVSYVSSNAQTRALVDSQPLANLTSTVNSFEIPEVFDNQGKDYDLLQYFDFRPIAANTIAPATSAATAPVNPSSALSFGNTASSANEKKFPLPGTAFICNVEEYLGRTDSVVISSDGRISVLTGKADSDVAKRYSPTIPRNSMKLTDLVVPAYPNLPIVRSVVLDEIIATRVMNGRYLKVRTDTKAITKARSVAGTVFDTPMVYTMKDFANFDRRLRDVEYYISLSRLEANIAAQSIPSSIDPTLNRFKYGFFADDHSTYAFSDRENPSYAAYIEDNMAVPEKLTWDMYLNGAIGGPDYVDHLVVNQENATWPDTLGPVCILQYVTYNVQQINGQWYLMTGNASDVVRTPIGPSPIVDADDAFPGG